MNLTELTELIEIKQYVINAVANTTIDRETVNYLNGLSILLDKKIIGLLKSNEFKEYVDYNNVKQAIMDAAKINNIKSGIVRK